MAVKFAKTVAIRSIAFELRLISDCLKQHEASGVEVSPLVLKGLGRSAS